MMRDDGKIRAEPESEALSRVLISLLKGVVFRDEQEALWQALLKQQSQVRAYVQVLGLALVIFEEEGYAWLKNTDESEEDGTENPLPKLISRRPLSYALSLLLALLRKQLLVFDAQAIEGRLVMRSDEIAALMQAYLPTGSNEVKWRTQLNTQLEKCVEMGFLRRLKSINEKQDAQYEVRRLLIAFIDAQWLGELESRLQAYRAYALNGALSDAQSASGEIV